MHACVKGHHPHHTNIPRLWSMEYGMPAAVVASSQPTGKGVGGAGLARPEGKPYALVTALVLVRPPNLPLMVMGMGCELGRGRDQKVHDAQAHAHSSCTSNE